MNDKRAKSSAGAQLAGRVWEYFSRRDVPLWATIVFALLGGIAANVILPSINQKHEYAKMKSAFVLQSLNDLNEQTSLLVALLTEINAEFEATGGVSTETKIKVAKTISALQWEAAEMAMFLGDDSLEKLENYKSNLNSIRRCIGLEADKFDKDCSDEAILLFLDSAEILGKELTKLN